MLKIFFNNILPFFISATQGPKYQPITKLYGFELLQTMRNLLTVVVRLRRTYAVFIPEMINFVSVICWPVSLSDYTYSNFRCMYLSVQESVPFINLDSCLCDESFNRLDTSKSIIHRKLGELCTHDRFYIHQVL